MNIIVVVDSLNSALGYAALARQKNENSVILASNQFSTPIRLVKAIMQLNPDVVLFAFRNTLLDALSINSSFQLVRDMHKVASIGILVPDYLEIDENSFQSSRKLIESIDFLLTTNVDLESRYREFYGSDCLIATYHDLVDLASIHNHRSIVKINHQQIIWVGNSKWGKRQGKIDHKGFIELITPIMKLRSLGDFSFEIIDSSVNKRSHKEVLCEIAKSSILLHPSKSEGTGLPILEAALLGCFPITTNVGIAQELLGEDFSFLIVDRDTRKLEQAILIASELENDQRERLIQTAEQFLNRISLERIPRDLENKKTTRQIRLSIIGGVTLRIKWFYRFLRNRLV
jgi:glycosyltransferase involved in cell wall biosynthesis